MNDFAKRLGEAREVLVALNPTDWSVVEAWIASVRPILVEKYPNQVEGFDQVTKTPSWFHSAYIFKTDVYGNPAGGPAASQAHDAAVNAKIASDAKNKILAFMESLAAIAAVNVRRDPIVKLSTDIGTLTSRLYTMQMAENVDADQMLDSDEFARELNWPPERLNRVIRALVNRGWLDVDETQESMDYDTRAFRLSSEGILAFEHVDTERPNQDKDDSEMNSAPKPDTKKVFIIHGRNAAVRSAVEQFVRSLGLTPLDFDHVAADCGGTAFLGDIVRRGLETAHGIIALFTPDELAALRSEYRDDHDKTEDKWRWQARPNVVFEAGMAYGMARKRTALVSVGPDVAMFSDVHGIHVVRLDNRQQNRARFRRKLLGMGCAIDNDSDSWADPTTSGDFEACVASLAGESAHDPFAEDSSDTASGGGEPRMLSGDEQRVLAVFAHFNIGANEHLPDGSLESHVQRMPPPLRQRISSVLELMVSGGLLQRASNGYLLTESGAEALYGR